MEKQATLLTFVDDEYSDNRAQSIMNWFDDIYLEFEKDPLLDELTEEQQLRGHFIVSAFYEYCYGYCLVGPGSVDEMVVNEVCLDVMPRKISADEESFEAFAPVITLFLQWCERKGHLSDTQPLRDYISNISSEMIENSQDPRNWGMAKSLFHGGLSSGYDMSDQEQTNQFIEDYNQSVMENKQEPKASSSILPYKRHTGKTGRNDNCPCGSGKKYKKCCLH